MALAGKLSMLAGTILAAYVAAYVCLLDPGWCGDVSGLRATGCLYPDYRVGGETARVLFRPAAWLDEQIRPDHWAVKTDS